MSSTIGDRVWLDPNRNVILDSGEPGIVGVTVLLFNQQDLFTGIKTTNNSGILQFSGINSGQYKLKFPQIEGLKITKKGLGFGSADSDIFNIIQIREMETSKLFSITPALSEARSCCTIHLA